MTGFKMNVLAKNIFVITLLILIPTIALSGYSLYYWANQIKTQEIDNDMRYMSLVRELFDTILNDCNMSFALLESDAILDNAISESIRTDGDLSASTLMNLNKVWLNASRILLSKPYIRLGYFYIENSKGLVFTMAGVKTLADMADVSWYDSYLDHDSSSQYWVETRSDQAASFRDRNVFKLFRKIPHYTGEYKGVIVVEFDIRYFDSMIRNTFQLDEKGFYIFDQSRNVIYNNGAYGSLDEYLYEDISNMVDTKKQLIKEIGQKESLVSLLQSRYYGWTYVAVMPMEILLRPLDSMRRINLIVCFIALIISMMIAWIYTLKNYTPIKTMKSIIDNYNEKKSITGSTSYKQDDYGYIIYNIINSFIEKSDIEKRLTEKTLLQRETQLFALQTQINPHFIYNIMETLNWESVKLLGVNNTVSNILIHLSKNMRYVTNFSNELVTIGEELDHLNSYLYIQDILNMSRIEFVIEADENVRKYSALKLLIQPIIENSIYHGLGNTDKKGYIRIIIKRTGNVIKVFVSDNGCGLTRDKLRQLRNDMRTMNIPTSQSLGLININQRVRLKFGNEYGIKLTSKPMEGTVVLLKFPVIEYQ